MLPYISSINALSTSTSTVSILQQEIPKAKKLYSSSSWLKYTAIQQLIEDLTTQTISTLCDLIIIASYLDIQNSEQTINFIQLATQALANKLLQSSKYKAEYDVINILPSNVQRMLVHYLIDNSAMRYALCSNSTDFIINTVQTLSGHTYMVQSVSWSPDGKYLASCSSDETIRVWNAPTGTCIHTLTGHSGTVSSVSWSSNGKYIASSSHDNTIKIWDARNGTYIHTLEEYTGSVNLLTWSPDNKYIASVSGYGVISIWDVINGTCIHALEGHNLLLTLLFTKFSIAHLVSFLFLSTLYTL